MQSYQGLYLLLRNFYLNIKEIYGNMFELNCFTGHGTANPEFIVQGPVVQSIVSLTNSLRGQLVKCFMTLLPNTHVFFC